MSVEVFAHRDDILGEGPLWLAADCALYWLDIGRKRLQRQTLAGTYSSWELPGHPGCVERMQGGDLVLALGEGLHRFEIAGGTTTLLAGISLAAGVRFNEGKCDPRGRLWVGSMQNNFGPGGEAVHLDSSIGTLFRVDARSVTVVEEQIGISNTLAWSPNGSRFYFADSLVNRIFQYDYDPDHGIILDKRLYFGELNLGVPDGSAMDVDGCLWNARWGAGAVLRITPDGRIDRCVEVPAIQPTSCAFGGPHLDTLFVTSARNGLPVEALEREPLSGSVFAITGVGQGLAVPAMEWEGS